ncbi:response regulator transcription factor [Romboutsia sedimentorum]|jgi:DNA-binding response OmpR family regulator|uniref:Stage 0 sporulation protein A homolog n=1 Tax=Romboutsia sedimentorum TaxID=1368474 RepID=A0ABT7EAF4_9FIRM|nr:response regulator transcription factor [Romboutsia sedimentorum]MDK2563912.1 response regulator transcription factor [Romboutsia sedimentorum]
MRILIIEDDIELGESLKKFLTNNKFYVDLSTLGEDGQEKAQINKYDCILLDLNLPDKDGIDVLKHLREEDILVPIIIITARDEIKERALGLDLGADDYLVKPFDLIELRARVNATIRRFYGRVNPEIKVNKLIINPKTRIVSYESNEISLSAKEFDILEYIANRHPEVVSSEDIAEHVYDEFFDPFSSVLRVHISNLKKKLKLSSGEELLITLKGKGYKL